jgi:transcription elongation GreA/GreB family factor
LDGKQKFNMIKEALQTIMGNDLNSKLKQLNTDIVSLRDSRNNDTKSSAGDKYETGREMAQIELNKLEIQLAKTKELLQELEKINLVTEYKRVEFGALVMSNQENYFISIPYGKIIHEGITYYAISAASPMGAALLRKGPGERVEFNGRTVVINQLI